MLVADLVDHPALSGGLVMHPGTHASRPVTGCAQTELMDPTPYLAVGELVLTTGMGLRFTDSRTWDAYAERLARAHVSGLAFALGRTHETVPEALAKAAAAHGLPLLEVSSDLPLLKIARHVWQELAAERYATVRTGWELADECTRLATEDDGLVTVLHRIKDAVGGDITLVEPDGFPLVSTGDTTPRRGRTTLNLPGGAHEKFKLQVDGVDDSTLLQPLLGPVAAVLAMQLSYTLASRSPLHSHAMARLVEALLDNIPGSDLTALATASRFDPTAPWATVTIRGDAPHAIHRRAAWRLRVALESRYHRVRFFEDPACTTFLMQDPTPTDTPLDATIRDALPPGTGLGAWYDDGITPDELGLVLKMARRRDPEGAVIRGPRLDLVALAGALPGPGPRAVATRLLAPLETSTDTGGTLRTTLDAYLRHSGATRAICDELFIHRNTLAYRIRRLEQLLDVDLTNGETRATLLLALRLTHHALPRPR